MHIIEKKEVINYLNDLFPKQLALKWDNVGEQIKNGNNISNVLICLDITKDVANYAVQNNVQLIISRHPLVFDDYENEYKIDYKKIIIDKLNKYKINVFSIHTNYDNSENNGLINLLKNNFEVDNLIILEDYFNVKLNNKISLNQFIERVKKIFNLNNFNFSLDINFDKFINNFYICSGSGGNGMIKNNLKDCLYLTGEVKWHHWIYANNNNVDLMVIGHYMENYFCDDIKNKLTTKFNNINILTFDISNQYK